MKDELEARKILLVLEAVQWKIGCIPHSLNDKIP
jgi:hypothetical protein